MSRAPPRSPLFPYTTLFRSYRAGLEDGDARQVRALLDRAAAQGLAGVAVTGAPQALAAFESAGAIADRHGLVLVTRGSTHDGRDRKSTRLNSSHLGISYAVF